MGGREIASKIAGEREREGEREKRAGERARDVGERESRRESAENGDW